MPTTSRRIHDLHQSTTPEVPRDYYATAHNQDAVYREKIRQGVNAVMVPRLKALLPDYSPCFSSYVAKRGKSKQGRVPLHQDYSMVDFEKHTALHIWCPLIDVDQTNGCLKAIPGSHTFFKHLSAVTGNPAPYDPVRQILEKECFVSVPMQAGSAFIFDERLLHCSEENQTDCLRIAVGGVLIPEGVSPLLYMWEKEKPSQLTVLEVTRDYLTNFKPQTLISEPYPEGVKFFKTIPYEFAWLTAADIAPLLSAKTSIPPAANVQPGKPEIRNQMNQPEPAPSKERKGWFGRLAGRLWK